MRLLRLMIEMKSRVIFFVSNKSFFVNNYVINVILIICFKFENKSYDVRNC